MRQARQGREKEVGASEQQTVATLQAWTLDPVRFVREAIGVTPSAQQLEGLDAYRRILTAKLKRSKGAPMTKAEQEDARKMGVSMMSGHGTGKDAVTSWMILHFMTTQPYCKIPCVAPVGPQLKTNLRTECHKWIRKSPILQELIQWQAEKIFWKEEQGREWFTIPRTVNVKASAEEQAETLAGIHEDHMLVVIDEASGVPDPVYRPLEGGLTGKVNFVLLLFNPTQNYGYAIESQTKYRADWLCLQWNAEESELVDKAQLERMAKKYGTESNAYRIRVKGMPPLASPDTLIPWEWVMEATTRDIPLDDAAPLVMGVDVGYSLGGDPSVIILRRGCVVTAIHEFKGVNTQELAGWAIELAREEEPSAIAIDSIGIGAGPYDAIYRALGSVVLPVNVTESTRESDQFERMRDELWWQMRETFQSGAIKIPADDELIGELSTIKYKPNPRTRKIKVEGKKELKERGISSPNKADALCLTEYAMRFVHTTSVPERISSWRRQIRAASPWV